MIGQMNPKQIADLLRSEALVEGDPDKRALFELAADGLEHKLPQGRKAKPHLQRQDDIVFVERYHELKRGFLQSGSKKPAGEAFQQLAVEYGLADEDTARRIYYRALKRSRLGRPGQE